MRGIVASQHSLNSSGCHDLQTTCGNPISSQIRLRSRLGSGTFGSVYYGFLSHAETGVIEIALKTLHFSESFRSVPHPFTDDKMGAAQLLREIQTHASIPSHPSIVQYIGYIAQPDGLIALAMEYLRGGTLESFLYDPSSLISHFNSLSNSNLMEFLTSTKSAVQALLRFWNGKPKTNDLTLEIPKNSASSSRLPCSFILFQFVEFINRAVDLDRLMRSPEHTHCSEISGDLPRKNLIGGLAHNLLSLIHIALIGKPSKHPLLTEKIALNAELLTKARAMVKQHRTGFHLPIWLRLVFDVSSALAHLHQHGYIHLDVRPANIIFIRKIQDIASAAAFPLVKLADLGGTRKWEENDIRSSISYRSPPEHIHSSGIVSGFSHDVFMLSLVMWELLGTGSRLFSLEGLRGRERTASNFQEIFQGLRPSIPENIPIPVRDLIQSCWKHFPHDRPTALQINSHVRTLASHLGFVF